MAGSDQTFGVTLTFGTTGFTAHLISVTPPSFTRASLETTHHGTSKGTEFTKVAAKTFTPSDLADFGELRIGFRFDKDDVPPIDEPAETVTVTYPLNGDTTAGTWAFSGFMTDYSAGDMPLEGLHEGTATIKVSGEVTMTPAVA